MWPSLTYPHNRTIGTARASTVVAAKSRPAADMADDMTDGVVAVDKAADGVCGLVRVHCAAPLLRLGFILLVAREAVPLTLPTARQCRSPSTRSSSRCCTCFRGGQKPSECDENVEVCQVEQAAQSPIH